MATTKIWNRAGALLLLMLAACLAGCMPKGPRALLAGKRLIDQGRYSDAIEDLRVATSELNTNAAAWNYLGLAYQYSGDSTNAQQSYEHALKLDHDLMEARFNLGSLWLDLNRPDLAKIQFTAYTLRRGNSSEGWIKLADAQFRLRELAPAEASYKQAIQTSPQNVESLNGLGLIQLQRNRPVEAAQYFNAALKYQPAYAPALLNLAVVSQQYLHDPRLALQKYREYLSLPDRPANWESVNATTRALEQQLSPAPVRPRIAAAPPPARERVIASKPEPKTPPPRPVVPERVETPPKNENTQPPPAQPSNVEVVHLNPEPAVKSAQDISLSPPPPAGNSTASAERSGVSPKIEPASQAPKRGFLQHINPLNVFRRDSHTVQEGGTNSDKELASSGLASGSKHFLRYRYRNPARPSPGNRQAAERAFAQGAQAQSVERHAEAIQAYLQAVRLDPAYYEAYYNLGLAATSAGNIQQALTAYELALAIRPDSVDARYNFALLLKNANYVLDSASELERILASNPDEARAHLILGNLYADQLNDVKQARKHYNRVLELDPHNPMAAQIRYWLMTNTP